ncbi:MAG TPA: hypothetical protein VKB77_00330 [Terriglobales bacterium]|nr:hypothetical protein [Terriglobales bacterium]
MWHSLLTVRPASLQTRITELCFAAVATEDPQELERIVPQLRAALQEQIAHSRKMVEDAKEVIAQLPSDSPVENRKVKRNATA